MTSPKNISASVRQRLLNRAKRDRRPFNELLQYYAMERLLYRLSQSAHADQSEKFEVMVKLGVLNSRMKDFYDIWLLSRHFDFDGVNLTEAIRLTFGRRGTKLPLKVEAFAEPFIEAKQTQWAAFCKRLQQDPVPTSFGEIAASLDRFLSPITAALFSGTPSPKNWTAPGPWT